jgi:pyrimidine operon attenuation protein / uracil phosphoribosyltransferase
MRESLAKISREIAERNRDLSLVALIGLPTRGVTLAERIAAILAQTAGHEIPVGQIDITFHRDDLELRRPIPHVTNVPFDINGRTIILVDDVLFTGRSVRAALDSLNDLGRPEFVQLAALIDRGHRRLPIAADFIGRTVKTDFNDDVAVRMKEIDGADSVEVHHS